MASPAPRSSVPRAFVAASVAALVLGACGKKAGTTVPNLDTWQGTAQIALESDGRASTLIMAKRGDTTRFEAPQNPELFGSYGGAEGPRHFLFDGKAKTLTLVVDTPKQALDYDVTVLDGLASSKQAGESDLELKETGRQDTIAGFSCDVWTGSSGTTTVDACVVKQTASAFRLGVGFLPPDATWARPLLDGEHVALSVRIKDGDTVRFKAQLTQLDQKVPEGAFEVPADYDRQNFLQALKRVQAKQRQ